MNTPADQTWKWGELDPLTRSVVATFAWRIGDESQGDLSAEAYIGSVTEAFDTITTEQVTKTAQWGGSRGMQNVLVSALSTLEQEHLTTLTAQLGRLAGDDDAVHLLAAQAGEHLTDGYMYDAISPLQTLSQLAVEKR